MNKKAKVLLITPNLKGIGDGVNRIQPSLGLMLIAANLEKRANGLMDKYEKAAKELGLDVKNSPASKEFNDILDLSDQINDNIQSIVSEIKSIK